MCMQGAVLQGATWLFSSACGGAVAAGALKIDVNFALIADTAAGFLQPNVCA